MKLALFGPLAVLLPAVALAVCLDATSLSSQAGASADAITGRWEFSYESQGGEGAGRGGGRGGRGADGPAGRQRTRVVMNLKAGPANTLTGDVVTEIPGGRAAAAAQPVEISEGRFENGRFSFKVWVVDGYRNRARYEGDLEGGVLKVTVSRDMPTGVERIAEGTAARVRR
jgi:hypothetical protein